MSVSIGILKIDCRGRERHLGFERSIAQSERSDGILSFQARGAFIASLPDIGYL